MIFLFTEIDHPEVLKEKGKPEADHILSCQLFLLEEILHSNGVHWMKRTPKGVLSAFEGGDPAKAAIAIQKDFQSHLWERFGKGKVKIVLHAGEAAPVGQTYVGPEINHARAILQAAWGGQVLFSLPAVHFIPVPPGGRLQDLGTQFLKDLSEPQNIYALQHPDLESGGYRLLNSLQQYPQNLSPQGSPFFGREEEIGEITELLSSSPTRLVTLVGPGGFGKTRLALQCAAEGVESFKDGAFLVALAPLLSDQLMVGGIASAVGFFFHGAEDPKTQLFNHLKEKEMLLVMDNFEHIIGGSRLVQELLEAAPKLKVLVTSREGLRLEGERILEVRGLRYPESPESGDLEASSAVQLFVKSARRVRPDFLLKHEERSSLLKICRLLEGMPLGIELSATWAGSLSLPEIADKIESSRDFLATAMPHLPPRHRSLRAVFEYSWILLSEPQKRMLKGISVFKGGFRAEAARKVAGASETDLTYLENKSILRRLPSGRIEIHELLKYYAKEKLFDDPAEKERVLDAHCVHFAQFLQKKEKELYGPAQKRALEDLTEETGNLREGWKRASDKLREKEIGDYLDGLFALFETSGRYQEAKENFQKAALALQEKYPASGRMPAKTSLLLARLLARWAFFENFLEGPAKAKKLFQESLDHFRAGGDLGSAGLAYSGLGIVHETRGDYKEAQRYYEQALKAFRKAKDRPGLVLALNYLGNIASRMNQFERAHGLISQSLHHSQTDKDRRAMAYSYNLLGDVFHEWGRFKESKEHYQKALESYLDVQERRGVGWSFTNLGRVAEVTGDYAGARQMYQEAITIFRDLGDRRGVGWIKSLLGNLCWATGDYQEGLKLLEEGLSFYQEVGDARGEAWALDLMGNIRLAMQDDAEAERLYIKAYSLVLKEGVNLQNIAWNDYHLGAVALFRGQSDEARRRFAEAMKCFERLADDLGKAVTLTHLGEEAITRGDLAKAEKYLKQSVSFSLQTKSFPLLADALTAVARLLKARGDEHKATSLLMSALSHPTCRQQTKDRVIALTLELHSRFPAEEVEGALKWAKASSLEAVASSWVSPSRLPRKVSKSKGRSKGKKKAKPKVGSARKPKKKKK